MKKIFSYFIPDHLFYNYNSIVKHNDFNISENRDSFKNLHKIWNIMLRAKKWEGELEEEEFLSVIFYYSYKLNFLSFSTVYYSFSFSFCFFFISSPCNLWRGEWEKIKKTCKHTKIPIIISLIYRWKDLDEMNLTTLKKVNNNDRSVSHELSKDKWAPRHLDSSCGSLRSSFMILLVSLDSYSRYFSNDIGDVIIGVLVCLQDFFSFFLSLFFSLSSLLFFYCKLCYFIFRIGESCT